MRACTLAHLPQTGEVGAGAHVRILENLTGITILLAWVGAVAMALLVATVMAMTWRAHADPPPELRAYGRPAELRPMLLSCLLAVVVMSLWPPTAFALGGALVELTLATQRRSQLGALPVTLPVEGVAVLTGWRLLGWTAIGLLPSALPEVLVGRDGIAGLAGLVWVGLALGVWAALRGAPTPFPLLAELAWVALRTDPAEEPPVVTRPATPRARAMQEHIEALAAEAAAPRVAVEDADFAVDAREAAARLARAAIAAQLAAMGISATSGDPEEEEAASDAGDAAHLAAEDASAADDLAAEEEQPEIVVVKGRKRAEADAATEPSPGPASPEGAAEPAGSAASEPTASEPTASEPTASEPAATEPAATEPATTDPGATEPTATEPPATQPVASEPAASEPTASEPPASEPPASEPPASEPAASQASSDPAPSVSPVGPAGRAPDPTEAPARPGSLAQAELEDTSEADLPG